MKLIPLQDWAIIKPSEAEQKTSGGLYIPDSAKDKPNEGVVEAIGPGALEEEDRFGKKKEKKERKFIPTTIKPGDRVLYTSYSGQVYKIGTEERILVRERDILGMFIGSQARSESSAASHKKAEEKPSMPAAKPEKKAAAKKPAAKKPGAKKK
jgi:chaperonin GroES